MCAVSWLIVDLLQFENHTAFFTEVSSLLQYVADSQNPKSG